jgi:hypothetical protein
MSLSAMTVYVTKEFARFARKAGLPDAKLLQTAPAAGELSEVSDGDDNQEG